MPTHPHSPSEPVPAQSLEDVLDRRVAELMDWLNENAPEIGEEQRHLDAETPERAYWHFGYMAALRDVRNCLAGKNSRLS